jgi:transcriptional regulator NrdR
MRCPNCGSLDTQVKDSRPTEDSSVIRRRRVCLSCNFRFTTFERVQLRELTVIKRNGRRVPFDRDKLLRSVQIALRKRPVDPERIEQAVSKIVRELESQGESEISSETSRRCWASCQARRRRQRLGGRNERMELGAPSHGRRPAVRVDCAGSDRRRS